MTALATRDAVELEAVGSAPRSRLGQVPLIALLAAIGVLVCAIANALSRATLDPPLILYFAGLAIIGLPIFWRLISREPSDGERLALVSLLGLALYGVKLVRDSFLYRNPDEFLHAFNAEQIVRQDDLFNANPILPSLSDYPGLPGSTSSLMDLADVSSYAGVLVVGAARLALMMALFLLYRRISGSARIAGLGAAIYTCNFNFMFFDAQYSYESLALPLLIVVLMVVAERAASARSWSPGWGVAIVLLTAAVVVTHHLSSYALAIALIALALLYWLPRRRVDWDNPLPFAILAVAMAAGWLLLVAGKTSGYLGSVFTDAISSAFETATGAAKARALFETSPSVTSEVSAPILARIIALLAVAMLALALPFGLREAWRRYRHQPFVQLACAAAIGFFVVVGLRLVPGAWETANRATEFLYVGLAFVVALAVVFADSWLRGRGRRRPHWLDRALLSVGLAVVLIGGAIAGWPWDAHLASPIRATAQGREIESEPYGMARWVAKHLPDRRLAASNADARIILAYGEARALAGRTPDIEDVLLTRGLESWQLPVLRRENVRYIVADRRRRSTDTTRGYSFTVRPPAGLGEPLLLQAAVGKFEKIEPAASITARVFDSGHIVIYELKDPK